jgi:hypothetical protein
MVDAQIRDRHELPPATATAAWKTKRHVKSPPRGGSGLLRPVAELRTHPLICSFAKKREGLVNAPAARKLVR